MELIKTGKTKDVYSLPGGDFLLKFKDTVTGNADTGESDPGGNQVVGEKKGVGSAALKMTTYYFELLKKLKVPTHYVASNLAENEMIVHGAKMFGNGLEFVIRYEAAGSFVRRFGMYATEGAKLPEIFEITLKDDARNDPPVTAEIVQALGLMTAKQMSEAEKLVRKVCNVVRDDLLKRGLELIDIKVEVGLVEGKVVLVDEISAGNMRVYKDREQLDYITLSSYIE